MKKTVAATVAYLSLFLMSLSLLSTNSVVSGQQLCELNINCTSCKASAGCGWCAKTGVCLQTSNNGATICGFLGGTWNPSTCPVETCANTYDSFENCSACKVATGCGWCNLPGLGGLCRQSGFKGFCTSAAGTWNPATCPTVAETCYVNNTDCTACKEYTTETCGWCSVTSTQGVCLRGSDGSSLCSSLDSTWTDRTCPAATTGVHKAVTTAPHAATTAHQAATTARQAATTARQAATTARQAATTARQAATTAHQAATTAKATTAVHAKATTGGGIGPAATTASSESTTASASTVTTPQTHTVPETDVTGATIKPTEVTTGLKGEHTATEESSGMRVIGAATLVSSIALALSTAWY